MKALIVPEARRLEIGDIAAPHIGPYDALVKMEICGICNSTDHKLVEGIMYWAPPFPFALGHESIGRVVEVGSKVKKFKVGDLVTRPVYAPPSGESVGAANGGFAEFGVVRDAPAMAGDGDGSLLNDYNAQRQNVVPQGLSARDAALCISLSECASVLRHLPNPRGLRIAVAGTGIAGLAFTLWLKLSGAHVVVLGRRAERLRHAQQLGADEVINTRDENWLQQIGPLDSALEATGDAPLAEQLLLNVKPSAFAVAYGVPPTGTKYSARWKTAVVEEHLSFNWVADLILRGWVKPEWFVSHEWNFDEVIDAFAQVQNGEVVKGFVRIHS